jgi:hypothetical protein
VGERDYALSIIQNVVKLRGHHDLPAGYEEENRKGIYLQRVYLLRSLSRGVINYKTFAEKLRTNIKNLESVDITDLIVDKTMQGDSLIEYLHDERIYPICLERKTSGRVVVDGSGYAIPERDLMNSLSVVHQSSRIKWPSNLPLIEDFTEELQTHDLDVNVEKGRNRDKNLLLFSVAQSIWYLSKVYNNNVLKGTDETEVLDEYDPLG